MYVCATLPAVFVVVSESVFLNWKIHMSGETGLCSQYVLLQAQYIHTWEIRRGGVERRGSRKVLGCAKIGGLVSIDTPFFSFQKKKNKKQKTPPSPPGDSVSIQRQSPEL